MKKLPLIVLSLIPPTFYFILFLFPLILSAYYFIPTAAHAAVRLQMPPNYLTASSGLVGYWTFDGKNVPWTSATAATAIDSSGQGNTGTLTSMSQSTSPAVGKIGQGLNFDGVNDLVNAGSGASLDNLGPLTLSAWIYPKSRGENGLGRILDKADTTTPTAGWIWFLSNETAANQLNFRLDGSTSLIRRTAANTITLNRWQHIVLTWDGSNTATNVRMYVNGIEASYSTYQNLAGRVNDGNSLLTIGNEDGGARTFDGRIDDVRIYNRVLSAAEVANLYRVGAVKTNRASAVVKANVSPTGTLTSGLVGYWTFDGKNVPWTSATAATAIDSSGQGNTGTLTSMSQSTSPAVGKIGQGLNFDGVNDYVNIGQPASIGSLTTNLTVSAWIKSTNLSGLRQILAASRLTTANGFAFATNGIGLRFTTYGVKDYDSTIITLTTGVWTYVTAVMSGFDVTFYVNGVSRQTVTGTANGNANTDDDIHIGASFLTSPNNLFIGTIDDVRVYNRVLSANEITQLYNLGR